MENLYNRPGLAGKLLPLFNLQHFRFCSDNW